MSDKCEKSGFVGDCRAACNSIHMRCPMPFSCVYAGGMYRWTSAYRFAWNPIITFESRVPRFLEWVELNCEPVAFARQDDFVGIAVEHPGIRLELRPGSLTVFDGAARGNPFSALEHALSGVFETMQPSAMVLDSFVCAWSRPLNHASYDTSRAAFARRVVGKPREGLARLTDASALADYEGDTYVAQVEWGVVEPDELRRLLREPTHGRLSENRPALVGNPPNLSSVPKTLGFAETFVRFVANEDLVDVPALVETAREADAIGRSIAEAVTQAFAEKEQAT